jgi:hypothetical protein
VADCVECDEGDCDAGEIDAEVVEPVDVNAEVDLEVTEALNEVLVVRTASSVVGEEIEVFVEVGFVLLVSSPHRPVSQGLVEQHPV